MKTSKAFKALDIFYIIMMILPFAAGIVLKVLTSPASDDINITGALIYFTIHMPVQDLPVTEAQVNSLIVVISVFFMCLYLTHGLSVKAHLKRQVAVEWLYESAKKLVNGSMGEYFDRFVPFISAILVLSALSSLSSLVGLFAPTSDINVVAGWAILVFILITYYRFKCGPIHYMKSFAEPIALMTPMNIISEIATPVSMSFRHYGNILSGSVISVLIAAALQGLSSKVLGWLPGFLGEFPFLRIGLPAVLSLYFDVFSGVLQAYIFAMLTMSYVSSAFAADEYQMRQLRKAQKKLQKEVLANK